MIIIALTLQRCEKFQEEGIDRKKKEFSAEEHREILMDWVPQALDRTSTGGKKLIQKEELDLSGADRVCCSGEMKTRKIPRFIGQPVQKNQKSPGLVRDSASKCEVESS